mmetsp:Transcript_140068/g.247529  ORF Transcript_140068/g.247529 Transcript_140068/m.247529 type:complete len:209 (+) Transcript_140068:573-1199(+)
MLLQTTRNLMILHARTAPQHQALKMLPNTLCQRPGQQPKRRPKRRQPKRRRHRRRRRKKRRRRQTKTRRLRQWPRRRPGRRQRKRRTTVVLLSKQSLSRSLAKQASRPRSRPRRLPVLLSKSPLQLQLRRIRWLIPAAFPNLGAHQVLRRRLQHRRRLGVVQKTRMSLTLPSKSLLQPHPQLIRQLQGHLLRTRVTRRMQARQKPRRG